jgi:hypothetical protein
MNMDLVLKAKQIAYEDSEKNGVPSKFQIDFSVEKATQIGQKVGANIEIVTIGSYLMDCMLGTAYKQGKLKEHIQMSADKAKELFENYPELTEEEKRNVLACILEHHGTSKFTTLESEVCCNADCYKFASVKGMLGSLKYMRDMELGDIIKLFDQKADEKWNALSLPECKKDLTEEYKAIKELLERYK